jgi:transporter family-2 protein
LPKLPDFFFMQKLLLLIPLLVGMGVVIQSGANTQLSAILGNPFLAALISFLTGTLALLLLNISMGTDPALLNPDQLIRTQWWMWLGGVMGAFFITSVIFIAPIIGPTRLFGVIIASQLIFSVVVDRYGWLGFTVQPINLKKIIGVLLLIAGAFLIQWGKTES